MLNISQNSIDKYIKKEKYSVFKKLEERSISKALIRIMIIVLVIGVISLFLPWTQNIRTLGYVTTLNPDDRPQAIQSLIDGRLEKWIVREGDIVSVGDTILILSESKEEYLDPKLLTQTQSQIDAKKASSINYQDKANTLDEQYRATVMNRDQKLELNAIKLNQFYIKVKTDSIDLAAAKVKMDNSKKQMDRTIELEKKGIKSTTDVEIKTFSYREAQAKVNEIENKLLNNQNDILAIKTNVSAIKSDFAQKLAKINSEKMSALSMKNTTNSEVYKLESSYNKYEARSNAYVITSPINGTITYAIKSGLGEYIKAGEDLVTIVPTVYRKAVESYIRPRDIPLLKKGQEVRIQFDGWPAIVFSGWPNNSFGTFAGRIYAIDNDISATKDGLYRILVIEDENELWPDEVRVGSGANSLILLNEVSVYYEIWRQLNGFPPDYYDNETSKQVKTKAPIKKFK
jgi:membrane fusion protein, adhesin transport system